MSSRRSVAMLAALGSAAVLAACGDNQDPEGAALFWERIQAAQYRTWTRAPGFETRQPSRASHGDSVDIFVNDVVLEALGSPSRLDEWPIGSVIVKDGYDGSDLKFVAAMEKRVGGWFWVEYDDDGKALFSGAPDLCTGCHRLGDDSTRALYLPSGL